MSKQTDDFFMMMMEEKGIDADFIGKMVDRRREEFYGPAPYVIGLDWSTIPPKWKWIKNESSEDTVE